MIVCVIRASNVAITASAITRSGRPVAWLALRRRANATSSVSPSFSIRRPFARSITFRAASASASDSASRANLRQLGVPRLGGGDRRDEVLLAERLDEVAEDTRLDRAADELVLAVRGEHHDRDRLVGEDPPRRLDSVEARHLDVEHGQLGRVLAGEGDRLLAVASFGDDLVTRPFEQVTKVEPDDRLVLRDQDPHGRRFAGVSPRRATVGPRVTITSHDRVRRGRGRERQVRRQPPLRNGGEKGAESETFAAQGSRGTYARHGSPQLATGARLRLVVATAAGRFGRPRP